MRLLPFSFLCALGLALVQCTPAAENTASNENKPIAKVNDNVLYVSDMQDIVPLNSSPKDSAEIVDRFVKNWIRKQLLFSQAKEQLTLDNPEIERKVEDYRYSLYIFELKKKLLATRLDSNVSEKEITDYYNTEISDFLLQSTIIKGVLIKIPLQTITDKVLKNQLSLNPLPISAIEQFCTENNFELKKSTDQWIELETWVGSTPFNAAQISNQWKIGMPYLTAQDKEFLYLLKITELKKPIEPAPIAYVKENIKAIILNKRKLTLANELEDQLFDEAVKKNKVEISYKPYSSVAK